METVDRREALPRQSGIELLKIIAIILIVISHVTETLTTDWSQVLGFNDYYINLNLATTNPVLLVLIVFRHMGTLGNAIFLICSIWFFIDKKETNFNKIIKILLDVFIISICWLIPILAIEGFQMVGIKYVIKSIFPTFFQNNWYITMYIIFCFIYPFLNIIIDKISKKCHLVTFISLIVCYLIIAFIYDFPSSSTLLAWISVYFAISYAKKYQMAFCDSSKINIILILGSFLAMSILIFLTILLGLKISFLSDKALYWIKNNNFFNFCLAFGLFNIFRKIKKRSSVINFVASLSLLVYVIHENVLFRTLIRPKIWQWIYCNFGYNYILLWHSLFVLSLLLISFATAIIYKFSLQRVTHKISNSIVQKIKLSFKKSN